MIFFKYSRERLRAGSGVNSQYIVCGMKNTCISLRSGPLFEGGVDLQQHGNDIRLFDRRSTTDQTKSSREQHLQLPNDIQHKRITALKIARPRDQKAFSIFDPPWVQNRVAQQNAPAWRA